MSTFNSESQWFSNSSVTSFSLISSLNLILRSASVSDGSVCVLVFYLVFNDCRNYRDIAIYLFQIIVFVHNVWVYFVSYPCTEITNITYECFLVLSWLFSFFFFPEIVVSFWHFISVQRGLASLPYSSPWLDLSSWCPGEGEGGAKIKEKEKACPLEVSIWFNPRHLVAREGVFITNFRNVHNLSENQIIFFL